MGLVALTRRVRRLELEAADEDAALARQAKAARLAPPFARAVVPQVVPPFDLMALHRRRAEEEEAIPVLVAFARELARTREMAEAAERERLEARARGVDVSETDAEPCHADTPGEEGPNGEDDAPSDDTEEQPKCYACEDRGMIKVIDMRTGLLADSGAALAFLSRKKP